MTQRSELVARLMKRVRPAAGGCWEFVGYQRKDGYGLLYVGLDGKRRIRRYAHRVAYEVFVGPIPAVPRHEIHHACGNTSCVNPAHLECLSRSAHARKSRPYARETCANGHARTPENVYVNPRTGHRSCRVCGAEAARRGRRRRRAVAA